MLDTDLLNDISAKLDNLRLEERVSVMWVIYSDDISGYYNFQEAMHIYRNLDGKFSFVVAHRFPHIHDIIRKCCNKLKIERLKSFLGLGLAFTKEEVLRIMEYLPILLKEYDSKAYYFNLDFCSANVEYINLPIRISSLEKEIEGIEKAYKTLPNLKETLNIYREKYKEHLIDKLFSPPKEETEKKD